MTKIAVIARFSGVEEMVWPDKKRPANRDTVNKIVHATCLQIIALQELEKRYGPSIVWRRMITERKNGLKWIDPAYNDESKIITIVSWFEMWVRGTEPETIEQLMRLLKDRR